MESEERIRVLAEEARPLAVKIEASMWHLGKYFTRGGLFGLGGTLGNWMEREGLLVWAMPLSNVPPISIYKVWYKNELVLEFVFRHTDSSAGVRAYVSGDWIEYVDSMYNKAMKIKEEKQAREAERAQQRKAEELKEKWDIDL